MGKDRAGHNGEGEAGTDPCRRWNQDQNRREQFRNARTDAAPRFESDFGEDVNRLRCSREFEEERLQENDRGANTANPGDVDVFMKFFSDSSQRGRNPYTRT